MSVPPISVVAYVALGSNLGDRRGAIGAAAQAMRDTPGVNVIEVSTLFDNPAVGGPAGSPAFLNAGAAVRTTLSAETLLEALLGIERAMGRDRRQKWEPRIIDLDLLLFGGRVVQTPVLTVPHPLMHTRRFVLQPLAEIAPQVVHPVLGRTIGQLLADLSD